MGLDKKVRETERLIILSQAIRFYMLSTCHQVQRYLSCFVVYRLMDVVFPALHAS